MKLYSKITKLKILGFIIITLFFISPYFNIDPSYFLINKPKISATYEDIEIDDTVPGSDWDWARTQPWCTQGSGTEGVPYVIDGETFTYFSGAAGNCLLIENSRAYFKIEGCVFLNSKSGSAGLRLNNVSNAEVRWSDFHNNSYGIHLSNCSNNIITFVNEIYENEYYGIYISDLSKKNEISYYNYIDNNSISGIKVINSEYCTISGNVIRENSINGIEFDSSEYNQISGNTIEQSDYGIYSIDSSHNNFSNNILKNNNHMGFCLENYCNNNSFFDNTANNNVDYGFYLYESNDVTLSENTANNNIYGIYSYRCDNINITGNFFKRNTNSGMQMGLSENNTIEGNEVIDNDYGGIRLSSCYNNTLMDNTVNSSQYGIELQSCNVSDILENKVNHNKYTGIALYYSNNNTNIIGNTAYNNSVGIGVDSHNMDSYYFNISENTVNNGQNGGGISTYGLNNSTISKNTLYNNSYMGIRLVWSLDNIIYENEMYYCGMEVYGPRKYMLSNEINTSNTVNNKPLYFYKKVNGLTFENFSNAGQIILINCNNSKITNVDLSYGSRGIQLYQCENNTLSNFNSSYNSLAGVHLWYSNDNKITGINTSYNNRDGIFLESSNNNNISNNIADYNENIGIRFGYGCNYNNISKNNLSYNGMAGIHIDNGRYNNLTNNLMKYCGLKISGSSWDLTTFSSNAIDTSNKVNEKNLYYYVSENNLDKNNFTDAGQIILISCNDSAISGLTISHTTNGVYLFHCENNQIIYSNFSNNLEAGTFIQECTNITVFGNIMENNRFYGIYIRESDNNKIINCSIIKEFLAGYQVIYVGYQGNDNIIYHNNIYGGGYDDGSNNIWDDGHAGNYWDDYTGVDLDQDGIGDSFYSIPGNTKENDTKPLMYPLNVDTDGDGLINYEEYTLGNDNYYTNVTNPDTDYDELSDYWEWLNSTDPTNPDTDSDNMPDGWEVFNLLNPLENDAFDDIDDDGLDNIYEYLNGTDPNNNDTDGDLFLDGIEVSPLYNWTTDPLNKWWYPMPNLAVERFEIASAEVGKPFVLNITIINDGIWVAENIVIIIWLPLLNRTLYNNSDNPIDLAVDEKYQKLIQVTEVWQGGDLLMEILLDPDNLINETYSSKDGSFNNDNERDNIDETILSIEGSQQAPPWDPLWTLFIIFGAIGIVGVPSSVLIIRPKMKRKAILKRKIDIAETDLKNFESKIRSFIKTKLFETYGKQWWERGIPSYIRSTIDKKSRTIKPKKPELSTDRMDLLDFPHYSSIITSQENWEKIFSEIFKDKSIVESNFESLRVFKRDLYEGNVTTADLSNFLLFIHAIINCIAEGFNVFLSYSTLDTDYFNIKEIASRLESYPKIDKVLYWEVDSGENIVEYMERTLRISRVFILFCSEHSIKSKAVEDEWHSAFQVRKEGKMKIVPVYEHDEHIPYLLKPLLNVKFNKDDFDTFVQNLYEEILR